MGQAPTAHSVVLPWSVFLAARAAVPIPVLGRLSATRRLCGLLALRLPRGLAHWRLLLRTLGLGLARLLRTLLPLLLLLQVLLLLLRALFLLLRGAGGLLIAHL